MPPPTAATLAADLMAEGQPLRDEIDAILGPEGDGNLEPLAALLNDRDSAEGHVLPYWIPYAALAEFAAITGLRRKVQANLDSDTPIVAEEQGVTTDLGSICLTIHDSLRLEKGIDFAKPAYLGMVSLLAHPDVAFLTPEQVQALVSLGSVPTSWADRKYGYPTTLSRDLIVEAVRHGNG